MYIRDERIGNSESEKLYTWASASLYNIQTHSINTINTRMYLFSSQSQHRAPYRMNILSGIESRSFLFCVSTAGAKKCCQANFIGAAMNICQWKIQSYRKIYSKDIYKAIIDFGQQRKGRTFCMNRPRES